MSVLASSPRYAHAACPLTPSDCVEGLLFGFLNSVAFGIFKIIGWASQALDAVIQYTSSDYPDAVRSSWTILRDFANMFFILGLIVIAGGTIFGKEEYGYRALMPQFILAALLINFSFAFGAYLIGLADGLSHFFLAQINGLSQNLANGFNLGSIATSGDSLLVAGSTVSKTLVAFVFLIVFLGAALLAILTSLFFVVARIVVLWFLLIISPLAWAGSIFPNLKKQTWDRWWTIFNSWAFFTPIYLLFLSLSFIILQAKNQNTALMNLQTATTGEILSSLFSLNDIIFYAVVLMFMFGGMWAAFQVGGFAGNGVGLVFNKIKGGVQKAASTVAGGVGRMTGASAAKSAVSQRAGELIGKVKEEGLPGKLRFIYGGERAERLKTARVAQFLGKKDAYGRQRLEEANKDGLNLRDKMQGMGAEEARNFLAGERGKGGVRGIAAKLEYAKRGHSSLTDYQEFMSSFGGENNAMGIEYLKNVKDAKFSNLFQGPDREARLAAGRERGYEQFVELRRELGLDLAERNEITNKEDFTEIKKIFEAAPREMKNFLNKVKAETVYGTKEKRKDALINKDGTPNQDTDQDLAKKLIEYMKDKDRKEINTTGLLERALTILGNGNPEVGRETNEGRSVVNEINKFNPVINIKYELGSEADPTKPFDLSRVVDKIKSEVLEKKTIVELAKLSPKFFSDPQARQAIKEFYASRPVDEFVGLVKRASPEIKEILRKLKSTPSRPPNRGPNFE